MQHTLSKKICENYLQFLSYSCNMLINLVIDMSTDQDRYILHNIYSRANYWYVVQVQTS